MAAESVEDPLIPPQKAPRRLHTWAGEEEEEQEQEVEEKKGKKERHQEDKTLPHISAPLSLQPATPPASPPAGAPQSVGSLGSRRSSEAEVGVTEVKEEAVVERGAVEMRSDGGEPRKLQWMENDDLPPMM